ncbi:MAG: hypothetical protein NC489_32605 [Ruminococcus flavefaciens]|nr:hypothetical protein [Ruminococcus flavefaciens]
MTRLEEKKAGYWEIIAQTRKSGRIAESVRNRIEGTWARFDEDVVMEALQIHMQRYPMYRETYTVGIMRNLQKRKDMTGRVKTDNPFGRIEQNQYDFEQLEKELLAN